MKIIITEQQLQRLNPSVTPPVPDDYLRSFNTKVIKQSPSLNKKLVYQSFKNNDFPYYQQILTSIGAKPSPENLGFLYAWRQAESSINKPSNYCNNPFHTSWNTDTKGIKFGGPESTMISKNKQGVKSYKKIDTGIKATINTLLSKSNKFSDIVNALRNENNTIQDILNASKNNLPLWGTNIGLLSQIISGYLKNNKPQPSLFSSC